MPFKRRTACRQRQEVVDRSGVLPPWIPPSSAKLRARVAKPATAVAVRAAPAAKSVSASQAPGGFPLGAWAFDTPPQPCAATLRFRRRMYRSDLKARDKGGAIVAVAAIHAALLFAFLHLSGRIDLTDPESAIRIFDLSEEPPPPPEPPPPQAQAQKQKPKEKEGGSAPKNIRSEATPVVAPKPKIEIPTPPKIATSETPREGTAPTQGASDVRGPGTGAGGIGTGTGSGTGGNGPGGGGDGGAAFPPRLVTPVLRGKDFQRDLLDQWPRGAEIFLRFRVDARGYVSECIIDRKSGVAAIDSEICNLAHQRLRFRPALNRAGQPVAGWFGYRQTAPR